jgi:hypothetical protein
MIWKLVWMIVNRRWRRVRKELDRVWPRNMT